MTEANTMGQCVKRQRMLPAVVAGFSLFLLFSTPGLCGQKSQLVSNLESGKKQTVVAYGTSLTALGAWVEQFSEVLGRQYPGLATVINSGEAGRWSRWGVDNLQALVIDKHPDLVFIEFSINDANQMFATDVTQSRVYLETMIDRILAARKSCEIILMVMNPPTGHFLATRPAIEFYNQMYRNVAAERHLTLIDHSPDWKKILREDPQLYAKYVPDGLHPDAEGCKAVITPNILRALGIRLHPTTPSPKMPSYSK